MEKNNRNNLIVHYDAASDALSLVLKRGKEDYFEELAPGVAVEFDSKGNILGFEILQASRYLKKALPPLSKKAKAVAV
jgi:uncharacterized protein YuzE